MDSMLARREEAMLAGAKEDVDTLGGYKNHRSEAFDRRILPLCRPLIETIGDRLALESARQLGAPAGISGLFEMMSIEANLDWYVARGHVTGPAFRAGAAQAYADALPLMFASLKDSESRGYVTAPILSDDSWAAYLGSLPSFGDTDGNGPLQPKL